MQLFRLPLACYLWAAVVFAWPFCMAPKKDKTNKRKLTPEAARKQEAEAAQAKALGAASSSSAQPASSAESREDMNSLPRTAVWAQMCASSLTMQNMEVRLHAGVLTAVTVIKVTPCTYTASGTRYTWSLSNGFETEPVSPLRPENPHVAAMVLFIMCNEAGATGYDLVQSKLDSRELFLLDASCGPSFITESIVMRSSGRRSFEGEDAIVGYIGDDAENMPFMHICFVPTAMWQELAQRCSRQP